MGWHGIGWGWIGIGLDFGHGGHAMQMRCMPVLAVPRRACVNQTA